MGQPPLGDDKPELKFPESLPHSGMEELHDYCLSGGRVILSATMAVQKNIAKKSE